MHCSNWEEFNEKVRILQDSEKKWVFRGQRDSRWDLCTSLERALTRFNVPEGKRSHLERVMLREFKRRLHNYTQDVPDESQDDEWMALMQHYGAPTRLLDVTYSPFVAAYFAFEHSEIGDEVAIWAINTDACKGSLESLADPLELLYLPERYEMYQKSRAVGSFKALFAPDRPRKFVLSITPYRLNDRIAFQRGAFLCPGDVTANFMDNLHNTVGDEDVHEKVLKFTMPARENRDRALKLLDEMNINRITLFPGMSGFAESFDARIPFFMNTDWDQNGFNDANIASTSLPGASRR